MESLPQEVLFLVFQHLHPLELVPLSQVSRRWHEVALHPRLHRCLHLNQRQCASSGTVCKYISNFKHSLEELHLQECYWLQGGPLSSALQKCRKLKSLNVMGCDVTKKTICSVLKLNESIRSLEWSVNSCDLSRIKLCTEKDAALKLVIAYSNELADAFKGLDCLTIRIPVFLVGYNLANFVYAMINTGVPIICSELCLNKFRLQWFDIRENAVHGIEIVIEGSSFQFRKSCIPSNSLFIEELFHEMFLGAMTSQLEGGTLHTFIFPDYHLKSCWQLHDGFTKLKTERCLVNMDIGSMGYSETASLSAILSVQSLHYLNLSGRSIDGHTLQVIAISSPHLKFLNLQDCCGCLEPLQGLMSLAECCSDLAQLNLKGVHVQASKESPNGVMEILSKFHNLVSLSLCTCALGPASVIKSTNSSSGFQSDLFKSSRRISHGVKGGPSLNSSDVSLANPSSAAAGSNSTPWHKIRSEESFDCMAKACSKITEFEFISSSAVASNFEKTYSQPPSARVSSHCEECQQVTSAYNTLIALTNWTCLRRLTLAVPLMTGTMKSLVVVTRSCPNLQFLSLAMMANLGHSGNVVILQGALSFCHQLRDLRLEQPCFSVTESFMLTLGELKCLERVCIIAREGAMRMYPHTVLSLFEKCCKLYYFQVLCDITIKASKAVMDSVTKRFGETRRGLVVSVVPFRQGSTDALSDVARSLPVMHLQEIFLFGTSVATRLPV